ncbi:MAG: Holliday junction resolvase RuvX, partial [Acidobacteriota bacterium]
MLALDPGTRRVGVAVSDPLGLTAQGLSTLACRGDGEAIEAVCHLVAEYEAVRLVVGLPVSLDGHERAAARAARRLAARLGRRLEIPIDMWDERLTSAEAERVMLTAGVRRRTRRAERDRLAAVLILQSWLDAHRGPAPDMRPQRALLGVGLAGLVTALVALVGLPAYLGPVDLAAPRTVVVPPGQGAGQTAADLEAAGVVRSRRAMQILVWWTGAGRRLPAGESRMAGPGEPR